MGLLVLLAVMAGAQFVALQVLEASRQRDREAQLLFVGEQYRRALASYARRTPAGAPSAPRQLEDLLEDRRFPQPIRHLRQLWPDPFTGQSDWVLIKSGDRIVGLHSRSKVQPMRQRRPGQAVASDDALTTVGDWRFVHRGSLPP